MLFVSQNISGRTKRFALRIARLYSWLPKDTLSQVFGKQLLRSGTSVGAHVREARHSRSTAELYSKVSVALQELEETRYWTELLQESGIVKPERLVNLSDEMDQLKAILYSALRTLKEPKAASTRNPV
jgi:four helix bundle protein